MKPFPDTAVVIATARRERLLRRTLDSLVTSRLPDALKEVLVVENGGAGGVRGVVEEFEGRLPIRYLFQDEGNKSKALNLALEQSGADLIYFLDDDVRVDEGAAEAYVEAAGRYGPGHHFSGPLVADWEEEPAEWLKPYLPPSATGWDKGESELFYDKPHFIGSNWAAFRGDMLAVGGFSEHIGPGSPLGAIGDEMELQQRLLDSGSRGVYLPSARAWHRVSRSDCDFDWARRRQKATGRTYGVLGWSLDEGAMTEGLAGYARLAILGLKVTVARALGWSEQRRAYLEMTRARTSGYLAGRRISRQLPESLAG